MSEDNEMDQMQGIATNFTKQQSELSLNTNKLLSTTPATGSCAAAGLSKIGRPCLHLVTPKAGPPPRDISTMSRRESGDNLSSAAYTDMYQETVKRFTRSSLSPDEDRSYKSMDYRRTSFDLYKEATGRRRSSDQSVVLTADTENFIIGQKVWVGGTRPGQIAYIGETHFAPGEWAGIVLDEPNGKNDGCVSGKRYFQCEPKRGIFSRLTRLTLEPLSTSGAISESPGGGIRNTPDRSRTVSPTASVRSSFMKSPGKQGMMIGDRVIVSSGFGSRPGILRFMGETQFASGNWCGIELDEASGKNDGTVDGVKYFDCLPKYGVFVPIAKVSLSPSAKKSRLSRTGSRDSLTSVGTMNSVATTNTSRLRMSAQKKQPPSKPVTVPKSSFSMQDVIREKQNHIEQLMIERDLDREDSQTQALNMQKNISELKGRILELEKQLTDEKKKTEELQFSVDEAMFCGDELNAQSQVYIEKIGDLEQKLMEFSTGNSSILDESENSQLQFLGAKLKETSADYEAKLTKHSEQEKNLQDNIKYLLNQNEDLQKSLLEKDSSLEKLQNQIVVFEKEQGNNSSKEHEVENLLSQLNDFKLKMESADKQKEALEALMKSTQESHSQNELKLREELESARTNNNKLADDLNKLKTVYAKGNEEAGDRQKELTKLREELEIEKANGLKLSTDVKEMEQCESKQISLLEHKEFELQELKEELNQVIVERAENENRAKRLEDELGALKIVNKELEDNVSLTSEEKCKKTTEYEAEISRLTEKVKTIDNALKISNEVSSKLESELKLHTELTESKEAQLTAVLASVELLKQESLSSRESFEKIQTAKSEELEKLSLEKAKLVNDIAKAKKELEKSISALNLTKKELSEKHALELEEMEKKHSNILKLKIDEIEQLQSVSSQQTRETEQVISTLTAKIADFEHLNKSSSEVLNEKSIEIDELKRLGEASKLEIVELTSKLSSHEKSVMDLTEMSTTLKRKLQEKDEAERIFLTSVSELNEKLSISSMELDKLREEKQSDERKLAEFEDAMKNSVEKSAKQELEISDISRKFEALKSKCESLTCENSALQSDLNIARSTSTDSNEEILKLSHEIADKQKSYNELIDKSSSERILLENQLQECQQKIGHTSSEIKTLQDELVLSKEACANTLAECEQIKLALMNKNESEIKDLRIKYESNILALESKLVESEKMAQDKITNLSIQLETLRTDLQESQKLNKQEADSKLEIIAKSESQLKETTEKYEHKISDLKTAMENELKQSITTNNTLNEAISKLQIQIQLLQDEMETNKKLFEATQTKFTANHEKLLDDLKSSHTNEKSRLETEFKCKLLVLENEKFALNDEMFKIQTQLIDLQTKLENSEKLFQSKETEFQERIHSFNSEQLDCKKLETDFETRLLALQEELVNLKAQNSIQAERIVEMQKGLIDAEHINNELAKENTQFLDNIATLEKEKCELASNFELFEIESDQAQTGLQTASEELTSKLSKVEDELTSKNAAIAELNKKVHEYADKLSLSLTKNETTIVEFEKQKLSIQEQLSEIAALKENVKQLRVENSTKESELISIQNKISGQNEIVQQLQIKLKEVGGVAEDNALCRENIQQLEEAQDSQNLIIEQLQMQIKNRDNERKSEVEYLQNEILQYTSAIKRMEVVNEEKVHEIHSLKQKIHDLQSIHNLKIGKVADITVLETEEETNEAQINFLNSIIAEMQKKNETLKARIEALESGPTDFTKPSAFNDIVRRKPAPRLFCDICDEFDLHETEDCPLQSSESPVPPILPQDQNGKERKLPPPRKYCESCEVFGHETGECDDDECY